MWISALAGRARLAKPRNEKPKDPREIDGTGRHAGAEGEIEYERNRQAPKVGKAETRTNKKWKKRERS